MSSVGVIVNQGKVLDGGLEELRSALADSGHADPPWYEVAKSKKAPAKVRKLVREDNVDRVLVWGGDGTVRRCIHTILDDELDASIGILPAGTGNLLANNLGIPISLRDAVDIAVHGEPRAIDAGVINDQHFAVMAGTGFDALMIRDADENELKDRFGRAGYVWAGINNIDVSPAHAEIEVDGLPWYNGDATCVIVANVGTILGGVQAFPDASPTDGRLDVGVVKARTKGEWAKLMASAIARRASRSALTEMVTAERLSIRLDRTFPWEVDGGDRDRTDTFEVRCVPRAIRICQPRQLEESP
jgi:YegS/Rv2252/BmrU family lipid kinase